MSSSSWMDEFFASFAYKKKEEEFLPPPPQPNNRRPRIRGVSSNKATDKDPIPHHPSSIRISIGGQTKVVSSYFPLPPGASTIEADSAVRAAGNKRPRRRRLPQQQQQSAEVRPPHTPDPKSRRRVSSSSSSSSKKTQHDPSSTPPSSWIRVTLGDETKVVSNYFPLPTGASNPVVLNPNEVDKAIRSRIKRVLDDGKPKRPQRERQIMKTTEQDIQEAEEEEEKKKKKRSRQLSAAEKKSDAYKRVEDGKWIKAPYSPYNLLQERHSFDPWRVLVICMLLNVTTGKQVSRVLPGLFLLCPNAEAATNVPEEEIEKEIQSLGIHTKRAKMIKQLSREYLGSEWTHVTQLHGVGKYAADAYAIFCAGKAEAVKPVDHMLVKYWKFVCGNWEG